MKAFPTIFHLTGLVFNNVKRKCNLIVPASFYSVTETKNGIASTKQFDAVGNVTSVTDAGGTITNNLRADGQPTSVVAPGNIITSFEYDSYGRRTKIIDPSAGTKTFSFDQWGNTNKETDANGKVTEIVYDQYGRILSKVTPEISTTYTYNADGLLQAETSNNGTGKEMTYDLLGRTLTYKETGADGKWLQKSYAYSQGRVATIGYSTQSGAITTETSHYQNGYLKSITLTGGQVIYDLQQENAMGRATKVLSGPVTRNYSFDQFGMPTGRSAQTQSAGTYMNFEYNFNATTGNLNYRKDVTRNITESFGYDKLNRLTGFAGQMVSYDNKENITQKSGIGNYHYLNMQSPAIELKERQLTRKAAASTRVVTEPVGTSSNLPEIGTANTPITDIADIATNTSGNLPSPQLQKNINTIKMLKNSSPPLRRSIIIREPDGSITIINGL